MYRKANESVKRKIEDCQEDEDDGDAREVKRQTTATSWRSNLTLLKLSQEDFNLIDVPTSSNIDEHSVVEGNQKGLVSRSTSCSWKSSNQNFQGLNCRLCLSSTRYPSDTSSFDCETQTYYFLPNIQEDAPDTKTTIADIGDGKEDSDKDHLVKVCCVIGCGYSVEKDVSTQLYNLPLDSKERSLWEQILKVEFEMNAETICSKHFVDYKSTLPPKETKTIPGKDVLPKAKTRKKRTFDIIIAEEAEKAKESLGTGRSKRTPKPNRQYDWAELIPPGKDESDDLEYMETFRRDLKIPQSGPGRPLESNIKREDRFHPNKDAENLECDNYSVDISLPSLPRAPPPKLKGRPPRIQDSCAQTDTEFNSSKGPLREVKVQCNITAQPLVTCSSCSNIEWQRLDTELASLLQEIQGEICHPAVSSSLERAISQIPKPSHAANVLRLLVGIEREILEIQKDIELVSTQDDLEEVEIDNIIHQEEAPITGVREITPKLWNLNSRDPKQRKKGVCTINLDEDADALGLQEATAKDDEEYKPPSIPEGEEEKEQERNETNEDNEWNIKEEYKSPSPKKKKKSRPKNKTGHHSLEEEIEDLEVKVQYESQLHKQSHQTNLKSDLTGIIESGSKAKNHNQVKKEIISKSTDDRWQRGIFNCQECGKTFTTKLKMDRHHEHMHMGVAPWKGKHPCQDCGKCFSQKNGLLIHRMHMHGEPMLFSCTLCDYKGATKSKVKRHMYKHYSEKRFTCNVCGQHLKSQSTYKNHMTLHTNEGKYKCDICEKAFYHKQYYEDHYKSHSNVRDYHCDKCSMAFKTNKALKSHNRIVHLQDKRIVCKLCDKRFMTNYNLRLHMKKHLRTEQRTSKNQCEQGISRYQCDLCSSKCLDETAVESHKRLAHPEVYQPVIIQVESFKSMDTVFHYDIKPNVQIFKEEMPFNAEIVYVMQEMEDVVIKLSDCVSASKSVIPIETVVAELKDSTKGMIENINVAYYFPCEQCSSSFPSLDLLQFHNQCAHLV